VKYSQTVKPLRWSLWRSVYPEKFDEKIAEIPRRNRLDLGYG
jgi:hypothetical protein